MAEESVLLAKYAERAERYDEMMEYMSMRVMSGGPLDPEERDLFSAAFKNALTGRRYAVRVVKGYQDPSAVPPAQVALASGYRSRVESELTAVCQKAIELIRHLLCAVSGDAKIFYLKMMADYNRYMAEFADDEAKHQSLAQEASRCYLEGLNEAQMLPPTHPTRLGLALNYSVFLHEVVQDTHQAITIAHQAMNAGIAEVETMTDLESKREATLTLTLLQDNLTLWTQGC